MKFTLQLYLGLAWICIVSMVFGYGAWGHIGALGKACRYWHYWISELNSMTTGVSDVLLG
jgi:hypothetical protein